MYFDNVFYNLLVIVFLIVICFLVNLFFNRNSRFLLDYRNSLNFQSQEFIEKYNMDENVKLDIFGSNANSDMDAYVHKNKCIFMNARIAYSNSILTLARTALFASKTKLEKKYPSSFSLVNSLNQLWLVVEVLGWGLILIGLLLKINLIIIIGLVIILVSFILVFATYKYVKENVDAALSYLDGKIKDKEYKLVLKIYKEEKYQHLFRPLISLVRVFPFLLCKNQKKLNSKELHLHQDDQK